MRKLILFASTSIIFFLLGGGFMYLVDTTWVYDKVDRHKDKLNTNLVRYSDALDVSQRMTTNCYDAFYTVSECSKEGGCNFEAIINTLTDLNLERKILKFKLDQLLDPTPPSFSPSKYQYEASPIRSKFLKSRLQSMK